jgi:hypothetical protein
MPIVCVGVLAAGVIALGVRVVRLTRVIYGTAIVVQQLQCDLERLRSIMVCPRCQFPVNPEDDHGDDECVIKVHHTFVHFHHNSPEH